MLMLINNTNGYMCNCYCPYFAGVTPYYSCSTVMCTQGCAMSSITACQSSSTVIG